MKKRIISLLAFTAMLMLPGSAWAEVTMSFGFVNSQNDTIWGLSEYNARVNVYSLGETATASTQAVRDDNWNFTGYWTLTFDDSYVGKTVSYETSYGQRGTFAVADGGIVKVQLVKLTVTVKDTGNQPVEDAYVYIYKPDGSYNSSYTNNNGQFSLYYPAGTGYSWRWGDQNGSFDLTADYALNITKQAVTSYTLTVGCRHGDYPYGGGYVYLYKYGEEEDAIAGFYNGSGSAKVDAGDYWLKDDAGVFSSKFTVSSDMTYWLEYHKVTFKSMTGTSPNVKQQIRVYYNYDPEDSYYYDYKSVNTDANGEATMYLQAGKFTYNTMGAYTDFTVGNADQTIAINTSRVTITLDCDATAAELSEQEFRWGNGNSSQNVEPENGKIVISPVMPGSYQLRINNMNTVDVEVVSGENNKTVKLYALRFTTNIQTTGQIYVNEGAKRFNYGTRYFLTEGEYSYSQSYYGNTLGTVNLTKNTDVPLNYGNLTVTVRDSKGVVADERVSFGNASGRTDENGQIEFSQLITGDDKFVLEATDCYTSKDITLVAGEQATTLTIPDNVTFTALHTGQGITGILWVNAVDDRHISYRIEVEDGVAKARLDPTLTYSVQGYNGTTAITEGCTVSLGTINVTCDGMGIALPMENWEAVSSYPVLVGATVRLAAIPVSGVNFQKWDINGTEYTEGMIDLTIKAAVTNAKAVFGGTIPSKVNSRQINTSFSNDEQYVYLPDDVNGTVNIYSMEGKQMKNIGVSGNRIGIYDLPAGAYILTLECVDGDIQVARFMK